MSAESDYLEWRKKPQVGCVFARLLASRYSDYPQHIQTVPTGRSPERIAADVAQRIEALVANPDVTATTLLFPDVESLEHTAQIMLALGGLSHWTVSTGTLQPPPGTPMVTVHIVRQIPFGGATCPSEVLILGPYQEFPPTRRAPITAFEMYVGEPRTEDPKTGAPTPKRTWPTSK
jgi:hypothetical protein